MKRSCLFAPLLLAGMLGVPAVASALVVEDRVDDPVQFDSEACRPVTRTVTLPAGARKVRVTGPQVGDPIPGPGDLPVGVVTAAEQGLRDGRFRIRITGTPNPDLCRDPETGADRGWSGSGDGLPLVARFERTVRVWVEGTGRGDEPAVRPRTLPFGTRSAIVNLRWSRWGGRTAIGRGRVEYNSCMPDCATARPRYFPVRVVLERARECGTRWKYTRLRFRYTTSSRPPELASRYEEFFGCSPG